MLSFMVLKPLVLAERSTSKEEMREKFETISEGGYANILYAQFGKERVQNELNEFLKKDLFSA